MAALTVCDTQKRFYSDIHTDEISDLLQNRELTVWLDLHDPSEADIQLLREEFGFHPLAIEDAVRAHERPKIDSYGHYYFIVFYTAHYEQQSEELIIQGLSLFVGPNYLVSVHTGAVRQIEETLARWQAADSPMGNTVGALLYTLLDAVVDDYFPLLDQLSDWTEDLEDTIFANFQESAIQEIFALKKDLLRLRRIVSPERDVLNVLLRREVPVFRVEDTIYLQDVYDHIVRITDSVDSYRDLISSALDSFLSLQSNRLNQVVKVLTVTSIVLMSNALIAGIYGMNFEFMPELGWVWGYPFALGLMVVVSAGLVFAFRKLRWL